MTDCIRRENAKKWLTNLRNDCVLYVGLWHYAEALDQIIELLSVDVTPKWIPCEERLPDIADTYIVSGKMKYSFEAEYEFFTDAADYEPYDEPHNYKLGDKFYNYRFHTWNDWHEGQDEYEILAWMPLPEPYGAERKDDETDITKQD